MNRRGFLEAAAAGLAAGTTGCGALLEGLGPQARRADLGAVLSRLEAGLAEASRGHLVAHLAPEAVASRSPAVQARLAHLEEVSRSGIRSLMVAAAVKPLSAEEREDPRVVALMDRMGPEMDDVAGKLTHLLSEVPASQHAALQRELRKRPDLPMQLAGKLDRRAGQLDVSGAARTKLRAAAMEVSFRLRRQRPAALIDEYLAKAERVSAVQAQRATAERDLAARVTSDAVWRARPGTTTANTGAIMLGVGAGIFGLSVAIGTAGDDGAIVVALIGGTLGILVFVAGLIVGLIGLIIMAASDDEPEGFDASYYLPARADDGGDQRPPGPREPYILEGIPCTQDADCPGGSCTSARCTR